MIQNACNSAAYVNSIRKLKKKMLDVTHFPMKHFQN